MKEQIHTIKLIEDDEMRGPGRRPSPIHYVIKPDGCWRIVNRAHTGTPGYEYPVTHLKGKQISAVRLFYVIGGNKLEPTEKLYNTCGNSWCVNPEHHRKEEVEDVLNR